jgi:acetylornithine/succinyldiaminopimelate/putrescine aminotransferase
MTFDEIVAAEEATELRAYAKLPVAPARGEGCAIFDERGERWLDLYGGHAVALTGHCHPRVVAAIRDQAEKLIFYSNVARSEVRARASRRLLAHAPRPGTKVFYCNSGAEANETAMKIARRATGRTQVVSFLGSFHGRSVATISATGIAHYREGVRPLLPGHVHVPFGDAAALAAAVDADTAAVLVEPIQSIGGAAMAAPEFYRACAAICRERGAALIFDELQTGLGRTGAFFFGEHVGVKPDMITLAKGLASGVPCGAVLVAPALAETVRTGDQGSTFGGGPLAMRALEATIAVIEDEGLVERAARMGARLRDALGRVRGVRGTRGMGLLVGIELDRPAAAVQKALLERRIITGTSGVPDVLRLLPPLVLGEAEVDAFVAALEEVLR